MVPSWANQLLPQLLMEQFDTLLIQCRHINICMKEFGLQNKIFDKMTARELAQFFPNRAFVYA